MVIKDGSTVSFHYTVKVGNDTVDTSSGGEPLTYVQGQNQIIPGVEKAVVGMKVGDKKSFTVTPEEGYGSHNENLVKALPREAFKNIDGLKAGEAIAGKFGEQEFQAIVVEVTDKEVTLDMNHPLAGQTLTFDVEIMEIK